MRTEDVKQNMKVAVKDNAISCSGLIKSDISNDAYGIVEDVGGGLFGIEFPNGRYQGFRAECFEPYVEHKRNTFGGRIDGNTITVHIGKATGTAKYNPADAKHGLPFRPEIGLAIAYMRAEGKTEDEVDIFTERLIHAHAKEQIAKAKGKADFVPFKPGDYARPIYPWGDEVWELIEDDALRFFEVPKRVSWISDIYGGLPVGEHKQALGFEGNDYVWPADHFCHASAPKDKEENLHSVTIDGVRYVPETEASK